MMSAVWIVILIGIFIALVATAALLAYDLFKKKEED